MITKGSYETRNFSSTGKENYDKIAWASKSGGRCQHSRSIGKGRVLCTFGRENVCPPLGARECSIANQAMNIQ